jgi:hypothetical protein
MSTQPLALALLSLVVAPISLPASALAGPLGRGVSNNMSETQEFCKDLLAEGGTPSMSLGECIALNNSTSMEKHNWWVHVCHNWRDEGLLENHYSSYSECVHDYETD